MREELDRLGLNKAGKKEELVERMLTARKELIDGLTKARGAYSSADEVSHNQTKSVKDLLIEEKDKRIQNLEEINVLIRARMNELTEGH